MKKTTIKMSFGGSLIKGKTGNWIYQRGTHPNRLRRTTGVSDFDKAKEIAEKFSHSFTINNNLGYSRAYRSDYYEAVRSAERRAKKSSIVFELTHDDIETLIDRCCETCEVTGIVFQRMRGKKRHERDPFMPSLDRIDSDKGYSTDNCRFTSIAANYAINTWGDWVLHEMARALLSTGRLGTKQRITI